MVKSPVEPQPAEEPSGSVHPLLARGAGLQQAGRLDEAAALYRELLANSPRDFDATHLLGVVALQRGEFADARRLIQSALAMRPDDPTAMGNLGTTYLRDARPEEALQWFDRVLAQQPDSLIAITNAASALHELGRYTGSIPLLRRAYALYPDSLAVCNLLGGCLIKDGELQEAAEIFERTTRIHPTDAETWTNLSVALNALGDTVRARECADKAVAQVPHSATALAALAGAQVKQGKLPEAIDNYRKAVASQGAGAGTLADFAQTLLLCGLHDEAVAQLRRAAQLDATNLTVRWAAVLARLKPVYTSGDDVESSRSEVSAALDEIGEWYRRTPGIREAFAAVGVVQPFYLAYHPVNNRELLSRYGRLCVEWMTTLPDGAAPQVAPHPKSHRLRIGFASAHISDHSVWNAITKGWVAQLDQTRFEIHLFHLNGSVDRETEAARRVAPHFEDRPANLAGWVQAIERCALDVLIYPEIGMDALTLQLAALRLAPLQAAAWGHPETTGLPTLDLYISADLLEPADAAANYSEKLVRLPNLGVNVQPLTPPATVAPGLRSLKLPRREPLLLCPGAPFKYSPVHDAVWVEIARGLTKRPLRWRSGGRLVFFRSRSATIDALFEARLRAAFDRAGVEFDRHARIVPHLDRPRFYGLMRESALMLDTLGFSGFNTALQGIECDLPVLAYEGEFMRGRLASAILRRLELPELVARTPDEFVRKAVELASDRARLRRLRQLIIGRRSVLFDDLLPVRALEDVLTTEVAARRPLSSA